MTTLQDETILADQMHHPVQCNYFLFYCVSHLCRMNPIMKNGQLLPGSSVIASNAQLIIWESGRSIKPQQVMGLVCIVFSAEQYTSMSPRNAVRSFLEAHADCQR